MIALRQRDQHVWDPRPHETEAETNYCETETETETKKVASRPRWSRDLNIPARNSSVTRWVSGNFRWSSKEQALIAFVCLQ